MLALALQNSLELWAYASAFHNLYWYYGLAGWPAGRATVMLFQGHKVRFLQQAKWHFHSCHTAVVIHIRTMFSP